MIITVKKYINWNLSEPEDFVLIYSTDNTCYESNDGTISLEITGGVAPYEIVWSPTLNNGTELNNLAAGIYDVTVTDDNGCVETLSIEIFEAPLFEINPVYNDVSCFGENDGYINLNILGGVPPYIVTWADDISAGIDRFNLGPGTYSVIVEDSSGNNCSISQSFIILEPQEIVLGGIVDNPIDCNNVNSGSIDLQVVGGTPPFNFEWNTWRYDRGFSKCSCWKLFSYSY